MADLASILTLLQMVLALLNNSAIAHTGQVAAITSQAVQLAETAESSTIQSAPITPTPSSSATSSSGTATSSAPAPVPALQASGPLAPQKGGVSVIYPSAVQSPPVTPTITFAPISVTYDWSTSSLTLSPTSNSGGNFTFTNDNSNVATISGNVLTTALFDNGSDEYATQSTTVITATQAAAGNYLSCVATTTLTVSCPTGYSGSGCDWSQASCAAGSAGQCENGGTCNATEVGPDGGPGGTCTCAPCWIGTQCNLPNPVCA